MDGLGWVELGWIGLGWVWFGVQIFFALYDFSFINLFVKAVFCIQDMRARCSPSHQNCHPLSTALVAVCPGGRTGPGREGCCVLVQGGRGSV